MTQSNQQSKDGGWAIGIPAPRVDQVPEAMRPFIELSLKLQSECMELCGHRARAWAEWPATFFACNSMEDLTKAQSEYLATMRKDYAQFLESILRDTMIEAEDYDEEAKSGSADIEQLEAA